MLPMLHQLASNMNGGKEPPFMKTIEKAMHHFAMLSSQGTGKAIESQFCRGLIIGYELKTIVMLMYTEVTNITSSKPDAGFSAIQ